MYRRRLLHVIREKENLGLGAVGGAISNKLTHGIGVHSTVLRERWQLRRLSH